MRILGVLLLLFIAIVGIVICAGPGEGFSDEVTADYSFDVEPVVIDGRAEHVAERICSCTECVLCERVTADYARPNDARLADARYNHYQPIRSVEIARERYNDRTVTTMTAGSQRDRSNGTQTGRFAGALA